MYLIYLFFLVLSSCACSNKPNKTMEQSKTQEEMPYCPENDDTPAPKKHERW